MPQEPPPPPPPSVDVLPSSFLSYLTTCPLPTLILSLPSLSLSSTPTTLFTNFAFRQLTLSLPLPSVLSPSTYSSFLQWLSTPPLPPSTIDFSSASEDPSQSQVDNDLEVSLHLPSLSSGNEGGIRLLPVVWRKTRILSGTTFIVQALHFPPKRLSQLTHSTSLDSSTRPLIVPSTGRESPTASSRVQELELLFYYSAVGLARLDLEGRLTYFSESWKNLTSHPEDRPKEDWSKCLVDEDYEKLLDMFGEARRGMRGFVTRFRARNGRTLLANCVPNSGRAEEVTGWVANLTDVTAQVEAEEAVRLLALERERADRLEERRRDAEEGRKAQEMLIDVTSHEIRNPISAILQNADLTRSSLIRLIRVFTQLEIEGRLPHELVGKMEDLRADVEAVECVEDCARAQERIANDILGLAQIGANLYTLTRISFSLFPLLRSILRMFSSECRAKDILLELEFGRGISSRGGEEVVIEADPVRLGQIWTNLISNAIRFTAGGAVRRVTVEIDLEVGRPPGAGEPLVVGSGGGAEEEEGTVCLFFAVNDTGPGMTESETKHVFEKFMQASALTHVTMGGSGLGLWIARSLCELHGGKIEVVSTPSVGSTFRGYIKARLCPSSSPFTHIFQSPTVPSPLIRLKILVADDNQVNRTILVRQLSGVGHTVETARDGKEALEMVERAEEVAERFDCCLMDVEMPVLDGISATRLLREIESKTGRRRLRVVGCTGNARDAQIQAALASGMDHIVTKPYRISNLLDTLAD